MSGPRARLVDADLDEIDLGLVLATLRRRWLAVLACAIIVTVIGAIWLRATPPSYRVEMEVAALAPAGEARGGRPSPESDPPAGMSSGAATPFTLYLESLHSRAVAEDLARDPTVLEGLFPADWDKTKGAWRPRSGIRQDIGAAARALLARPPAPWPPGGMQVREFLVDRVVVEQDQRKHAFATIHLQSAQPAFAVRFLGLLNQAANDQLRADALARSRLIIANLDAVTGATTSAAFAQARAEQLAVQSAAATPAFAAEVLDPPSVQPEPISRPVRSLLSALVVGLAAGAGLALSLDWFAGRQRRAAAPTKDAG
jgi:hypothetical protein